MEHLLLEYKRHGGLGNFNLALLYQSKRCLFVEGSSDIDYLRMFADRLGSNCFRGSNQIVMFEFSGADKVSMVKDLVDLFERMVGSEIKWMVLRDRDYYISNLVQKCKEKAIVCYM
jgi:predicted ATP-dependent endonuclease of OLD family